MYLHHLARLQQRLFKINRYLYYLDSHPIGCWETIEDLITEVTGNRSRSVRKHKDRLSSEFDFDSSCEDDNSGSSGRSERTNGQGQTVKGRRMSEQVTAAVWEPVAT